MFKYVELETMKGKGRKKTNNNRGISSVDFLSFFRFFF